MAPAVTGIGADSDETSRNTSPTACSMDSTAAATL